MPARVFLRSVLAVASTSCRRRSPPARPRGHFVPYPPDGASVEAAADRLRSNSPYGMPSTSVHEAHPGHHWHLAHLAATQSRPLARCSPRGTSPRSGPALYAKQMMREQAFFHDSRHGLGQVDLAARLFRAARMVVDPSLPLGEMPVEEATAFMATRTALGLDTDRAEVTPLLRLADAGAVAPDRGAGDPPDGAGVERRPAHLPRPAQLHRGLPLGIAERLLRS